MTREEQITQAAFEAYPENIGYDSIIEKFKDYNLHDRMKFIEGAKWADEHPKTTWSDEDEYMMDFCCGYLDPNQVAWIQSLKQRIKNDK